MSSARRPSLSWTPAGTVTRGRLLPEEIAIALCYNGVTQAVMMATPADLEDFARGFSLTEGLAGPAEIAEIAVRPRPNGIELQIWLAPGASARLAERRRAMTGPVGCGLCGIESLDQALREPPPVSSPLRVAAHDLADAMAALRQHQPLHDRVHAAHAAAFWQPGRGVALAREDVGRHNALDKLAGALSAAGSSVADGAVLLTSRVSVDLVQKVCRLGVPVLAAISAPTVAAVEMSARAGLTLVALAAPGHLEVFTHPERLSGLDGTRELVGGKRNVA